MAFSFKSVLASIQPSHQEIQQEKKFASELAKKLQRHAPSHSKVVIAGSIAKGTFLRSDRDIDVFLLLSVKVSKNRFEALTKKLVKRCFPRAPYEIKYAEHPYVRLFLPHRKIDVVPAYAIRHARERLSAVDRSVLHTRYILSHLRKNQVRDVLLLKKFLKSNELYGAEIRVRGFSGYLCELLILKYRNFSSCLRAVRKWSNPFIDLKKFYKTKNEQKNAVKKFSSPLVVIDPTDKYRNVAAAVSKENLKKFVAVAKKFLARPSMQFFSVPPSFSKKIEKMKKKKGKVYVIKLKHKPVVEDIIWGQLRKLFQQLQYFIEKNDFQVLEHELHSDGARAFIALRVTTDTLPKMHWIKGPLVSLKKNVRAFKRAHRSAKFKTSRGRVHAKLPRKHRNLRKALRYFFTQASLPTRFTKKGIRVMS